MKDLGFCRSQGDCRANSDRQDARHTRSNWKRIKPGVAKDPKTHDDSKQSPNVLGVEPVRLVWATHESCGCVAHQGVKQEWQRRDHQRIKFNGPHDVAM
jgi:hypothetical protein